MRVRVSFSNVVMFLAGAAYGTWSTGGDPAHFLDLLQQRFGWLLGCFQYGALFGCGR